MFDISQKATVELDVTVTFEIGDDWPDDETDYIVWFWHNDQPVFVTDQFTPEDVRFALEQHNASYDEAREWL